MRHVIHLVFLFLLVAAGDACAQTGLSDTMMMQEVVIRSNNSISWHKDTTVYIADSFNHSQHNMAEDVLKKLPGVDVSIDGKISVEGKEVNRIFINGKEAGVNDIRNLTQNLPAHIIDRIQVADLQSEESRALGIKEASNEKIINLKLKDEYDNGVYGRAAAGAGNNSLYQGSVFSNYMAGDTRLTLIGYANNTGNSDISNSSSESMGSGQGRNAGTLKQRNINSSFSLKPTEKLDISGSLDLGQRSNTTQQNVVSSTFLPGDTVLLQNQYSDNNADSRYARISTRGVYTFSKRTSLNANVNLNLAGNKPMQTSFDTTAYNDISNYNFSRNATTTSEDDNNSIAATFMLQRNSNKEGRNFVVRYNVAYTGTNRDGYTATTNEYRAGNASFNNTTSQQDGYNLAQTFAFKGTEPLGKSGLLSAEYSLQLYNSKDTRNVFTENNNGSYVDTIQGNDYEYSFDEHNVGLQYQYNHNNTTVNAGLRAQPFSRRNHDVLRGGTSSYAGINYFPLANFRYAISKRWHMDASYNGSMRAPSINQVQPAPDYSDSLNITLGNPNLKPELGSSFNLSANYLHPVKERSLWVRLNYSRTDDRIVNNTTITANKRISVPINADGVYNASASTGYSMRWKKKYRLKAGFKGGGGNNIAITNNVQQKVYNFYYQPNASVNMTMGKMETELDYSLRSSYTTGNSISSNNRLLTHTLSLDSKVELPGEITVSINVNYMSNTGLSGGFDNNFVLANAGVYKGFKKPAGLFIKVQGYDLLNNYPNTRRTVYDNVIEDRSYNRIGRYVLFSAIYRFSHFF